MRIKVILVAATALAGAYAGTSAQAATVGSASLATQRSCSATAATALCDGTGPGQQARILQYGGGVGIGGTNYFNDGRGNLAWSDIGFDAGSDLPTIRAFTGAAGNVRMNINAIAFQSFTYTGAAPLDFSITGALHMVDSSASAAGGALPGGAIFTQYVGIWNPSAIAGLNTAQELFTKLFFAGCGTAGVLGAGGAGGDLTGGSAIVSTATTSACAPGSLTLTTGQEILVVAGLQLPVNRGGFADSTSTFTTRLGDNLTVEAKAEFGQTMISAIDQGAIVAVPEPATWAMMIAGFGLAGASIRRKTGATTAFG